MFMFCNTEKQGLDDGGTMQLKIDFDFVVGMFFVLKISVRVICFEFACECSFQNTTRRMLEEGVEGGKFGCKYVLH